MTRCTVNLSTQHVFHGGFCRCGKTEAQVVLDGDRQGVTYEAARDRVRLNAQMQRTFDALADGEWHSPEDLEKRTGDRWASISARCRDLRKAAYGGHDVQRTNVGGGQWQYRLVVNEAATVSA